MNLFIPYLKLMRFDKPIGILLLLWPTLWALWLASEGVPDFKFLIIFALGVVVMRSGGCVINDIIDRDVDARVLRTKNRPLATGAVTKNQALILFSALMFIAFCLALFLNMLTIQLAFVGFLLAGIYPFLKRFTNLPQLFLGLAFAWPIPMAFAAVQNAVPAVAWFLFLITGIWIVAYDTLYAMVDRDDDLQIGVKSTAILFASFDRIIVGVLQLMVTGFLFVFGLMLSLNVFYFASVCLGGGLFCYQQFLIKDRDTQNCFTAFLNNNWFGLIIFIGIVINYLALE